MGNSESRPSPGEDLQRGGHGGDENAGRPSQFKRSSQAAGKDPGRESRAADAARSREARVIDRPESGPPKHDLSPGAGPPGSEKHVRGWREGDAEADTVLPGQNAGAGGGKTDGPSD